MPEETESCALGVVTHFIPRQKLEFGKLAKEFSCLANDDMIGRFPFQTGNFHGNV